jgi:hypothetical protein
MDDKDILEKAKEMRRHFETESVDEEKVQENFSDKLHSLLRSIFGDDTDAAYELVEKGHLKEWRKKAWLRNIKKVLLGKQLFYITMLIATIAFLVSEAATFYAGGEEITIGAYYKAILTELAFIFLAGYVATDKLGKWLSKGLLVGVFCLMMFVISAETLTDGVDRVSESGHIARQVETLEKQIKEKDDLIEYYIRIEWPRNATTTRIERDQLVKRLLELQDRQAEGTNEDVAKMEQYKSYGNAFFRGILLMVNILLVRRAFKL